MGSFIELDCTGWTWPQCEGWLTIAEPEEQTMWGKVLQKRLACENAVGDPERVSAAGLAHHVVEKSYGLHDFNL